MQVQAAVDAVLRPVPAGASHTQLRARLRLMAEVYRKTRALAEDLQVRLPLCQGAAQASPCVAGGDVDCTEARLGAGLVVAASRSPIALVVTPGLLMSSLLLSFTQPL